MDVNPAAAPVAPPPAKGEEKKAEVKGP